MIEEWENAVLLWIQEYVRNPMLTPFFQFVTWLGNMGMIWIILAAICMWVKRTRKAGIAMSGAMFLSFLINNLFLKTYFGRIRPYEVINGLHILIDKPGDYSFPSGHTACGVAAAAAFWMAGKRLGTGYCENRAGGEHVRAGFFVISRMAMAFLAGAIAFSRLYLGVHYPTDVAAGALSGWIMAWISVRIVAYMQNRTQ